MCHEGDVPEEAGGIFKGTAVQELLVLPAGEGSCVRFGVRSLT